MVCRLNLQKISKLQSRLERGAQPHSRAKMLPILLNASSTSSGRKHGSLGGLFFSRGRPRSSITSAFEQLNNPAIQGETRPHIVDIPLEPYPTDTRKYLIIPGHWPEIYPPTLTLWDVLKAHMSFIPSQPALFNLSGSYSYRHSTVITFQNGLQSIPPWTSLNWPFLFNQNQQ